MNTVSITEAKNKLTQIVHGAEETDEPIEITRHGDPAVVLISYRQYSKLIGAHNSFSELLQNFRKIWKDDLLEDNELLFHFRNSEAGRVVDL